MAYLYTTACTARRIILRQPVAEIRLKGGFWYQILHCQNFAVLLGIFEMCSVLQSGEERYEAKHLGALQVEVSRDLKNTMLLQKSTPASS